MIGTPQDEEKKDEVLQQINDLLEKYNWGHGTQRLVVKIVFEGKFNLRPFQIHQKEESDRRTLICHQ